MLRTWVFDQVLFLLSQHETIYTHIILIHIREVTIKICISSGSGQIYTIRLLGVHADVQIKWTIKGHKRLI